MVNRNKVEDYPLSCLNTKNEKTLVDKVSSGATADIKDTPQLVLDDLVTDMCPTKFVPDLVLGEGKLLLSSVKLAKLTKLKGLTLTSLLE